MSPRVFLHVLSVELRSQLSYRADFWINAFAGFLAEFGVTWFLWAAVFAESGKTVIGGYTFPGMVLYFLAVVLLGKLVSGREFEGSVAADIYEGTLNRYLVFPASYAAFKYAQRIGHLGIAFAQFVLFGAVAYLVLDLPRAGVTPLTVAMALVTTMAANLLYFLVDNIIQYVAFWADNVWSLDVAKRWLVMILGGQMAPLSVFPGKVRSVLEFLPFRFFCEFPARVFLGDIGLYGWLQGLALMGIWGLVAWLFGRLLWHRGQLQYAGVGI
ncbi:MAG TPA: ABC-2 family transporter protein [Planctomycetota bacterium]|nr:ABC-2 family transporter protein [Planctomycetota bacterium]